MDDNDKKEVSYKTILLTVAGVLFLIAGIMVPSLLVIGMILAFFYFVGREHRITKDKKKYD